METPVKVVAGVVATAAFLFYSMGRNSTSNPVSSVDSDAKAAELLASEPASAPKSKKAKAKAAATAARVAAAAASASSAAASEGKLSKSAKKKQADKLKRAEAKVIADAQAKAAAAAKPQEEEEAPLSKAAKKKAAKKKAAAAAAAATAAAALAANGGKKKKPTKAQKAAAAAADAAAAAEAETAAVVAVAAAAAQAEADAVEENASNIEDGWSVVEVKKKPAKKKKVVEGADGETPNNADVISIARRSLASIIGRGGENIKAIQELSGARIDIPKEQEGEQVLCTISGSPEEVALGRDMVLEYVEFGGPKPEATEEFASGWRDGMLLVGPGGSTINRFQTEHKCRIKVTREGDDAVITVSGGKDDVQHAVAAMRAFITSHNYSKEVAVEGSRSIQALIGTKGARVQEIQSASGARVDVRRSEGMVRLTGTQKQVDDAHAMVIATMERERGPPQVGPGETYEHIVLGGAVGQIVGGGGKKVLALQERTGAKVDIKDDQTCYVIGQPEAVAAAAKEINEIIARNQENLERVEAAQTSFADMDGADGAAAATSGAGWDVPTPAESWGAAPMDAAAGWGVSASGW